MYLNRYFLAGILSATMSVPAAAQLNPSRTITLVVPIGAGGGVDATGRLIAEKLQERLKQPVVVENRPAGGGMVGTDSVAKATPDGHTLLVIESSAALHKWFRKDVPYDVVADFAPVAQIATSPLMLFAAPSFPANDIKELIALARKEPGKLSAGTPGVGTPHHLALMTMNALAKIEIMPVPYRGAAASVTDLLAGQIPMTWAAPTAVMPHVANGKAKVLGVASPQRLDIAAAGADHRRERRAGLFYRSVLRRCRAREGTAGSGRAARQGACGDFQDARGAGAHSESWLALDLSRQQ